MIIESSTAILNLIINDVMLWQLAARERTLLYTDVHSATCYYQVSLGNVFRELKGVVLLVKSD